VELMGAFLGELAGIAGYVLLFAAVYKLFQIATELTEIKQVLENQARSVSPALAQSLAPLTELRSSDDASDYAEKLLRAVNAESHSSVPVASSISEDR
jgi:hypothetical protein